MNGCQGFIPNQWKPDVCSDCMRSRAAHSTTSEHAVTPRPDLSASGPESDTAPQYSNMPLTDSRDKKRSSLKKKFNSLLRGTEKAPIPAPRKGFVEALDISEPIPIQLDPSGKFKSESSFDSVSSLDGETHSVGDELAVTGSDRPYEEVFYEGDPAERGEASGDTQQRVTELSVDEQPSTAESPGVPNAEDIASSSMPPLPHTNGTRTVVDVNGYSELDLDDFDGPPVLVGSTVQTSVKNSRPMGIPEAPQADDFDGPPVLVGSTVQTSVETSRPMGLPESPQTMHAPEESVDPSEESQRMDPLEESRPIDPPEESQPMDHPRVKPPLSAKPKINIASQAASRRIRPPPPPPYSKKPSLTSEEREKENGSESPKGGTEPAKDSIPHTETPLDSSPLIVPRPRRRSKTVGSGATGRRPPPPPPKKAALDVHFPLSTPRLSKDDEDTTDVPPSKPARSRARTAHTRMPGLSPVPTRNPPVRSTSPHSNSGSSLEPQQASHSPTHSPVPSPLAGTATTITKESSPALKRTNSFSKRMKHKFGFRSNSKPPPAELVVSADFEEQKQKEEEEQKVVEVEKKGKIKKLFRKRSKTFSGQKKPTRFVANSASRDDSSMNFKGTNSLSSPTVRPTQSPEASLLNSTRTFHNATAEMTVDNSHEYAECGEPLFSKQSPLAKGQEASGSQSGGSHRGASVSSPSARPADDRSSMCSEFLASLQPETIPIDPLIISVGQLQTLMAEAINDATKKVSSMYKRLYTPPSSIKCTWDDCMPVSDWPAVVVKGKTYSVQVSTMRYVYTLCAVLSLLTASEVLGTYVHASYCYVLQERG